MESIKIATSFIAPNASFASNCIIPFLFKYPAWRMLSVSSVFETLFKVMIEKIIYSDASSYYLKHLMSFLNSNDIPPVENVLVKDTNKVSVDKDSKQIFIKALLEICSLSKEQKIRKFEKFYSDELVTDVHCYIEKQYGKFLKAKKATIEEEIANFLTNFKIGINLLNLNNFKSEQLFNSEQHSLICAIIYDKNGKLYIGYTKEEASIINPQLFCPQNVPEWVLKDKANYKDLANYLSEGLANKCWDNIMDEITQMKGKLNNNDKAELDKAFKKINEIKAQFEDEKKISALKAQEVEVVKKERDNQKILYESKILEISTFTANSTISTTQLKERLERAMKATEEMKAEANKKSEQLKTKETELQAKINEIRKLLDRNKELYDANELLKSQLQAKSNEMEANNKDKMGLENNITQLKQKLEQTANQAIIMDQLKNQLKEKENTIAQLTNVEQQSAQNTTQINTLQAKIAQMDAQIKEANSKIVQMDVQIKEANSKIKVEDEQKAKYAKNAESKDKEIHDLQDKANKCTQEMAELKEKISQLKKSNERYEAEIIRFLGIIKFDIKDRKDCNNGIFWITGNCKKCNKSANVFKFTCNDYLCKQCIETAISKTDSIDQIECPRCKKPFLLDDRESFMLEDSIVNILRKRQEELQHK